MGNPPGFLQGQRASKLGHAGAPSFENYPHDLVIGPRRLPANIGEVRYVGHLPNPPAVHAMTPDAIPVIETHHDDLFLLGTAHPIPGTTVHGLDMTVTDIRVIAMLSQD
jgi:hypothetical protein